MQKIGDLVGKYKTENSDKYVSQEFQKYAYELAKDLDDLGHKSLYMKIVKESPRSFVERARSFVADATGARSKARLFMWKLKQIKLEAKDKEAKR